MMGGGGILWLLIVGALVVIPFWKLLPRFGIPNWVAIFAIFPVVALILLWVMAFKDDGLRG
ncbi:hypothetical protein SAMN05421759_102485 [Roseivivax lentus]|uniref:Uncharacterized protein n=1 Tax=Roseivivax lentus TaxID=633194 RepID=A0A1N7L908_9RHOB|nr:hypothetical protein [Roseivivax lentus]SIS70316.1 hypothetical protein SAMN05421759_102485 [Roseivivax lentus]